VPETKSMLIVADTNVLVSALIGKRLRIFLDKLKQFRFELLFSNATYDELFLVLKRTKFEKYITPQIVEEFSWLLSYHSQFATPTEKINICRDLKDNIFFECAASKSVDYIVTGDPDLLSLHSFRNIPIITPDEFIKEIDIF
jgi:uncharacterized protein